MVLDAGRLRAAIRVAGGFVASGREDANADVVEEALLAEALIAFAKVIQKQPKA